MTIDTTVYYTRARLLRDINIKLAGESLTWAQLQLYVDSVIDDINTRMDACYPTTAEMDAFIETRAEDQLNWSENPEMIDYVNWNNGILSLFPYAIVRKVIVVGAAVKWLTADEEGINTASDYTQEYRDALYNLQRDWANKIPERYKATDQGYVYNDAPNKGISYYDFINERITTNQHLTNGYDY